MTDHLLRAKHVAKILDCSEQHVRALAWRGILPSVRFSTKPGKQTVRFREEDVQAFIRQHLNAGGARLA